MKLYPKARPVQINKLRLGGKDINTKEDLLNNFCFSEIIKLGDKFIQWLNRHNEVKDYASSVSQIFSGKRKESQKVKDLLSLFFPEYKNTSLDDVVCFWHEEKTNTKILEDLLNYISPNISKAEKLMTEFPENNLWMKNWLEKCAYEVRSSQNLTADFCFLYGKFCEHLSPEESKAWMREAVDKGHVEARKYILKDSIEIWINRFHPLKFILINPKSSELKSFYISTDIIRGHYWDNNKVSRNYCYEIIRDIERESKYKLNFPSEKQLEIARKHPMFDIGRHDMEITENGAYSNYSYRFYTGDFESMYFRPILDVDENLSLL